jgi:hypothetical protein
MTALRIEKVIWKMFFTKHMEGNMKISQRADTYTWKRPTLVKSNPF